MILHAWQGWLCRDWLGAFCVDHADLKLTEISLPSAFKVLRLKEYAVDSGIFIAIEIGFQLAQAN